MPRKFLRSLRSLRSSAGFGLIETIIASAILGIILFGVMQVGTTLSGMIAGAKLTSDFSNLTMTLQSVISNSQLCTDALANVPANALYDATAAAAITTSPTPVPATPSVPSSPPLAQGMDVVIELPGTGTPAKTLQAGAEYREYGIRVNHLRIYASKQAGTSADLSVLWSVVLQLKAEKLNATALGGTQLAPRDIGRFFVRVDTTGKIKECGSASSNLQDACTAVGGAFDPVSGTCKRCTNLNNSGLGSVSCYCPSDMNKPSAGVGNCNPGDISDLASSGAVDGTSTGGPSGWRQTCMKPDNVTYSFASCSVTCCNMN